jgi:hypothetical protein
MTASRTTSKEVRGGQRASRLKPIEHSVYLGRERLGRYVQMDRKRFEAFDALDRPLGNFRVRARALTAIRKAWARQA